MRFGLACETMRVLALRAAHVIGAARTTEKGRESCESIVERATPIVLEVSDFDSVAACEDAIQAMQTRSTYCLLRVCLR
jgi:NADP-dependent 3-hydroxy acid dehydrogenase YdfG